MTGEGPAEHAGPALRSECGIDRPDRALRGVCRADLHQLGRQACGDLRRRGSVVLVGLRSVGGLVDEDHVDVRDVVELVAAALAHRDHGEPDLSRLPRPRGPGRRRARRRGCRRQGRRARPRRRRHRARGRGRARRAEAAAAGRSPAARRRPRPPAAWRPVSMRRVRADGLHQRRADRPRGRPGGAERRVGEHPPVVRVADQVVGQRGAGAEDESRRIAVPSSAARAVSSASRSSTASASRTSADSAALGSADRPRIATSSWPAGRARRAPSSRGRPRRSRAGAGRSAGVARFMRSR